MSALVLLGGCDRDPCGKTGGAAEAVRQLSPAQLSALFQEAAACAKSRCTLSTLSGVDFDWQRGAKLDRRKDNGSVVLAMCFDHGVDLKFSGLGSEAGLIELSYGEHAGFGTEVLWQSQAAD